MSVFVWIVAETLLAINAALWPLTGHSLWTGVGWLGAMWFAWVLFRWGKQ